MKAIEEFRDLNRHDEGIRNWVNDNVPELAESEDERIRKRLIENFKWFCGDFPETTKWGKDDDMLVKDIITWLEKQVSIDKEKMLIGARKDVASSIITYLDRNTLGMCLSNMECEDLVNAVVDSDWSKVYDYMKKKLEKQVEKPQEKTTLEVVNEVKADNANKVVDFKAKDWYVSKGDGKIHNIYHSDKVEQKFKIGDWVVGEISVYKIISLNDELNCYMAINLNNEKVKIPYYFDDGPGHMCSYHLWTIQDAKPGDVLVCKGNVKDSKITYKRICLFENLDKAFFTLTKTSNGLEEYDINVNIDYPDNTVPATKEQKEILFMTMKEVGYKLDVEN